MPLPLCRVPAALAALWVYKLRSQGQLLLMGYRREDTLRLISLEAIGPQENFYRDLKRV